MSRSERLLALLQHLRRHRHPVSGATLAADLGISLRTLYRGPLLPGVELAVVAARRLALQRRVQRGLQAAGQRLGSLGHADAAAMASAACESLPDL